MSLTLDSIQLDPVNIGTGHELDSNHHGPALMIDSVESEDLETGIPEREPLEFNIPIDGITPEIEEVMVGIKQLAEKLLYHWKRFPLVLPPSITDSANPSSLDDDQPGPHYQDVITFKDLFMAPTFDELELVAMETGGNAKVLNEKQLNSIRQVGEFEVESINFAGQVHRWRLTQLLQKGIQRAHDTLLHDAALSLRLVIITARNRFHSQFFSLSQAVKAWATGLWQLLDILIGMPYTTAGNLKQKLREEHQRFLVAELDIRQEDGDSSHTSDNLTSSPESPVCKLEWNSFCEYIKDHCKQLEAEKHKTTDFRPPPIPYRYQTPKGTEIDLRLFNKDLLGKCMVVLRDILEREARGWHHKFKDRLIAELKDQNLTYDEISEKVNSAIMEEYLRRVFEAITTSEDLENLQPRIGPLLVQQAKAAIVMTRAVENVRHKLNRHRQEHKNLLISSHPVKSKIKAWMNEQLALFVRDFVAMNQWSAHEEAIEVCRNQNLDQAVYFLHRDLIFMRDREAVLKKELGKVKTPTRIFKFRSRIWLPGNWVIRRHLHGETDVIPTVIVETPSGVTAHPTDPDEPTFSVEKYSARSTTTRYPFWRWFNYLCRTWAWSWNAMFWLGVVIPWCSPVSLRALFFPEPFMPNLQLNQVNGTLCPKQSSLTQTLVSRLRALWRHVRHSRTKFESEPDTSFLGKAFTRHVNRFWNYVVKGALGSFCLVLVFPPICILSSGASLAAAVTTPLWMPVATLCTHVFAFLVYDFDHPNEGNAILYLCEAVIWRMLILGCLQPLGALATAVILCPVGTAAVAIFGVFRRGCRSVWDTFMFHAVIKKRGRVPSSDSFVARRIAGPGLASNYFYQIKPEQALAAVEAQMELHELIAWQEQMGRQIDLPKHDYGLFVIKVFKPFSASLSQEGVYKHLCKETDRLHILLNKETDLRRQRLRTGLNPDLQNKIKLTGRELKVTVTQTAKLLEAFYPDRVLQRFAKTEEQFWEDRNLEYRDWQGFATQILSEIFSTSFLTPLEDTDTCFKLEVQHLNMSRYIDMLKSAEFRDDLDVVSAVHTPKGDIDVDPPHLEINVFSPVKSGGPAYPDSRDRSDFSAFLRQGRIRRKPWKGPIVRIQEVEKMEIPSPIPHPAVVSALIHNRENDQDPIDLEDPVCRRLLRATENLPYMDTRFNMGDSYEVDPDLSTPDHTTNSEPEVMVSHLAESEHAFSEDNMNDAMTPDSMPESAHSVTLDLPDSALYSPRRQHPEDNDDQEGSVVYHESEADNSCVLDVESDAEEEEEEDYQEAHGDVHADVRAELPPREGEDSADDVEVTG